MMGSQHAQRLGLTCTRPEDDLCMRSKHVAQQQQLITIKVICARRTCVHIISKLFKIFKVQKNIGNYNHTDRNEEELTC
jgi:hypothetical protein